MASSKDRVAFVRAHEKWATGDFDGFLDFLHDDIIYIVNVDGMQVPYAMSGLGKADVQDRLQLVLETFVVIKFDVENIVHEDDVQPQPRARRLSPQEDG